MPGAGNDPFSNSSVQNVLQHIISPKVVNDGSDGYVVKTDLVNVDNIYITGTLAANSSKIGVGEEAGKTNQGSNAVAVGSLAGSLIQGFKAVSIGSAAGYTTQGEFGVAIGASSGGTGQGSNAVSVGGLAGNSFQGVNAVALGYEAGSLNQHSNSIVINATGTALQSVTSNSFVVKPIRGDTAANLTTSNFKALFYNSTTGELCYSTG